MTLWTKEAPPEKLQKTILQLLTILPRSRAIPKDSQKTDNHSERGKQSVES